ncbi:hypothetical protein GW17_00000690, partial [Ensete ventricosum]
VAVMGSKDEKPVGGGFFSAITSSVRNWGSTMHKSVNGYEFSQDLLPDRDGYWKMMHKYIGSDVTSMVTLPVIIFEPMTVLQKMAEVSCTHLAECTDRAGRYEVDGYVYSAEEEPKILMTGKWNESMSCQPCDQEGEPLPGTELKEVHIITDELCFLFFFCIFKIWRVAATPEKDKFQYTYFAHKINSFDTASKKLLASDSRLRPDRYALEKGDMSKAAAEKSRLEERQRAEKRNREAKGHQFTPRWFNMTGEVTPTPWGDLEVYEYNGRYTEHRARIDSSGSIDEIDINTVEFNPWQYGDLSAQ